MVVTGAGWCDLNVYTSKGIYVQRRCFDPVFWTGIKKKKLLSYNLEHFIKFASAECVKSCAQLHLVDPVILAKLVCSNISVCFKQNL